MSSRTTIETLKTPLQTNIKTIVIALAILLAFTTPAAASTITCDNGEETPTCVVDSFQELNTGETYNLDGNLEITENGELNNLTNNESFYLNVAGNFTMFNGSKIHSNANISAENIIMEDEAEIDASELGYLGGRDDEADRTIDGEGPGGGDGATAGGAGGGYGGDGGISDSEDFGENLGNGLAYGDREQAIRFGSGGGAGATEQEGEYGGDGGGRIILEATDTITMNGTINVSGGQGLGVESSGGGGAGGGIRFDAPTIQGKGQTIAIGGDGATAGPEGGGGAGGRIFFSDEDFRTGGFIENIERFASGGDGDFRGDLGSREPAPLICTRQEDNTCIVDEPRDGFSIINQEDTADNVNRFKITNNATVGGINQLEIEYDKVILENGSIESETTVEINTSEFNITEGSSIRTTQIIGSIDFAYGENYIIELEESLNLDDQLNLTELISDEGLDTVDEFLSGGEIVTSGFYLKKNESLDIPTTTKLKIGNNSKISTNDQLQIFGKIETFNREIANFSAKDLSVNEQMEGNFRFDVSNLMTIDETIDSTGKGFLGGNTEESSVSDPSELDGEGPGGGEGDLGDAEDPNHAGAGGGYGGDGGMGEYGAEGGTDYGKTDNPYSFGSGGGGAAISSSIAKGGNGGGFIEIDVRNGTIIFGEDLKNSILAKGEPGFLESAFGNPVPSGGGSGGTVRLHAGEILDSKSDDERVENEFDTDLIDVSGGEPANSDAGGGSGGRVLISNYDLPGGDTGNAVEDSPSLLQVANKSSEDFIEEYRNEIGAELRIRTEPGLFDTAERGTIIECRSGSQNISCPGDMKDLNLPSVGSLNLETTISPNSGGTYLRRHLLPPTKLGNLNIRWTDHTNVGNVFNTSIDNLEINYSFSNLNEEHRYRLDRLYNQNNSNVSEFDETLFEFDEDYNYSDANFTQRSVNQFFENSTTNGLLENIDANITEDIKNVNQVPNGTSFKFREAEIPEIINYSINKTVANRTEINEINITWEQNFSGVQNVYLNTDELNSTRIESPNLEYIDTYTRGSTEQTTSTFQWRQDNTNALLDEQRELRWTPVLETPSDVNNSFILDNDYDIQTFWVDARPPEFENLSINEFNNHSYTGGEGDNPVWNNEDMFLDVSKTANFSFDTWDDFNSILDTVNPERYDPNFFTPSDEIYDVPEEEGYRKIQTLNELSVTDTSLPQLQTPENETLNKLRIFDSCSEETCLNNTKAWYYLFDEDEVTDEVETVQITRKDELGNTGTFTKDIHVLNITTSLQGELFEQETVTTEDSIDIDGKAEIHPNSYGHWEINDGCSSNSISETNSPPPDTNVTVETIVGENKETVYQGSVSDNVITTKTSSSTSPNTGDCSTSQVDHNSDGYWETSFNEGLAGRHEMNIYFEDERGLTGNRTEMFEILLNIKNNTNQPLTTDVNVLDITENDYRIYLEAILSESAYSDTNFTKVNITSPENESAIYEINNFNETNQSGLWNGTIDLETKFNDVDVLGRWNVEWFAETELGVQSNRPVTEFYTERLNVSQNLQTNTPIRTQNRLTGNVSYEGALSESDDASRNSALDGEMRLIREVDGVNETLRNYTQYFDDFEEVFNTSDKYGEHTLYTSIITNESATFTEEQKYINLIQYDSINFTAASTGTEVIDRNDNEEDINIAAEPGETPYSNIESVNATITESSSGNTYNISLSDTAETADGIYVNTIAPETLFEEEFSSEPFGKMEVLFSAETENGVESVNRTENFFIRTIVPQDVNINSVVDLAEEELEVTGNAIINSDSEDIRDNTPVLDGSANIYQNGELNKTVELDKYLWVQNSSITDGDVWLEETKEDCTLNDDWCQTKNFTIADENNETLLDTTVKLEEEIGEQNLDVEFIDDKNVKANFTQSYEVVYDPDDSVSGTTETGILEISNVTGEPTDPDIYDITLDTGLVIEDAEGTTEREVQTGTFEVSIDSDGYQPKTKEEIEITENETTSLEYILQEADAEIDITEVTDIQTGEEITPYNIEVINQDTDERITRAFQEQPEVFEVVEGTYGVNANANGYLPSTTTEITLNENDVVPLDFQLDPEELDLQENTFNKGSELNITVNIDKDLLSQDIESLTVILERPNLIEENVNLQGNASGGDWWGLYQNTDTLGTYIPQYYELVLEDGTELELDPSITFRAEELEIHQNINKTTGLSPEEEINVEGFVEVLPNQTRSPANTEFILETDSGNESIGELEAPAEGEGNYSVDFSSGPAGVHTLHTLAETSYGVTGFREDEIFVLMNPENSTATGVNTETDSVNIGEDIDLSIDVPPENVPDDEEIVGIDVEILDNNSEIVTDLLIDENTSETWHKVMNWETLDQNTENLPFGQYSANFTVLLNESGGTLEQTEAIDDFFVRNGSVTIEFGNEPVTPGEDLIVEGIVETLPDDPERAYPGTLTLDRDTGIEQSEVASTSPVDQEYFATFSTDISGEHNLSATFIDEENIEGYNHTTFTVLLDIDEQNATFEETGTSFLDGDFENKNINISAFVTNSSYSDKETVNATITSPSNEEKMFMLENETDPSEAQTWSKIIDIDQEFGGERGSYEVEFNATTMNGLASVKPTTEFFLQELSVTQKIENRNLNIGETSTVTGNVTFSSDDSPVEDQDISIFIDGEVEEPDPVTSTDIDGFYTYDFTAPDKAGNFTFDTNATTEEDVQGGNRSNIYVLIPTEIETLGLQTNNSSINLEETIEIAANIPSESISSENQIRDVEARIERPGGGVIQFDLTGDSTGGLWNDTIDLTDEVGVYDVDIDVTLDDGFTRQTKSKDNFTVKNITSNVTVNETNPALGEIVEVTGSSILEPEGEPFNGEATIIREIGGNTPETVTTTDIQGGNFDHSFDTNISGVHQIRTNLTSENSITGFNILEHTVKLNISEPIQEFTETESNKIDVEENNKELNLSAQISESETGTVDTAEATIIPPNSTIEDSETETITLNPSDGRTFENSIDVEELFNNKTGRYHVIYEADTGNQIGSNVLNESFEVLNISISQNLNNTHANTGEEVMITGKVTLQPYEEPLELSEELELYSNNTLINEISTAENGEFNHTFEASSTPELSEIRLEITKENISGEQKSELLVSELNLNVNPTILNVYRSFNSDDDINFGDSLTANIDNKETLEDIKLEYDTPNYFDTTSYDRNIGNLNPGDTGSNSPNYNIETNADTGETVVDVTGFSSDNIRDSSIVSVFIWSESQAEFSEKPDIISRDSDSKEINAIVEDKYNESRLDNINTSFYVNDTKVDNINSNENGELAFNWSITDFEPGIYNLSVETHDETNKYINSTNIRDHFEVELVGDFVLDYFDSSEGREIFRNAQSDPSSTFIQTRFKDSKGEDVEDAEVTWKIENTTATELTDENGFAGFDYEPPQELEPGNYTLNITAQKDSFGDATFDREISILGELQIEDITDRKIYNRGINYNETVNVTDLLGNPRNQNLNWYLDTDERKVIGSNRTPVWEVNTDERLGNAEIELSSDYEFYQNVQQIRDIQIFGFADVAGLFPGYSDLLPDQEIEITAKINDSNTSESIENMPVKLKINDTEAQRSTQNFTINSTQNFEEWFIEDNQTSIIDDKLIFDGSEIETNNTKTIRTSPLEIKEQNRTEISLELTNITANITIESENNSVSTGLINESGTQIIDTSTLPGGDTEKRIEFNKTGDNSEAEISKVIFSGKITDSSLFENKTDIIETQTNSQGEISYVWEPAEKSNYTISAEIFDNSTLNYNVSNNILKSEVTIDRKLYLDEIEQESFEVFKDPEEGSNSSEFNLTLLETDSTPGPVPSQGQEITLTVAPGHQESRELTCETNSNGECSLIFEADDDVPSGNRTVRFTTNRNDWKDINETTYLIIRDNLDMNIDKPKEDAIVNRGDTIANVTTTAISDGQDVTNELDITWEFQSEIISNERTFDWSIPENVGLGNETLRVTGSAQEYGTDIREHNVEIFGYSQVEMILPDSGSEDFIEADITETITSRCTTKNQLGEEIEDYPVTFYENSTGTKQIIGTNETGEQGTAEMEYEIPDLLETIEITCEIEDNETLQYNASDTLDFDSDLIVTEDNTEPEIFNLTAEPETAQSGDTIEISFNAEDRIGVENASLEVIRPDGAREDLNVERELNEWFTDYETPDDLIGTYQIIARASDISLNTGVQAIRIDIEPGATLDVNPEEKIIDNMSYYEDENIEFSANFTPEDSANNTNITLAVTDEEKIIFAEDKSNCGDLEGNESCTTSFDTTIPAGTAPTTEFAFLTGEWIDEELIDSDFDEERSVTNLSTIVIKENPEWEILRQLSGDETTKKWETPITDNSSLDLKNDFGEPFEINVTGNVNLEDFTAEYRQRFPEDEDEWRSLPNDWITLEGREKSRLTPEDEFETSARVETPFGAAAGEYKGYILFETENTEQVERNITIDVEEIPDFKILNDNITSFAVIDAENTLEELELQNTGTVNLTISEGNITGNASEKLSVPDLDNLARLDTVNHDLNYQNFTNDSIYAGEVTLEVINFDERPTETIGVTIQPVQFSSEVTTAQVLDDEFIRISPGNTTSFETEVMLNESIYNQEGLEFDIFVGDEPVEFERTGSNGTYNFEITMPDLPDGQPYDLTLKTTETNKEISINSTYEQTYFIPDVTPPNFIDFDIEDKPITQNVEIDSEFIIEDNHFDRDELEQAEGLQNITIIKTSPSGNQTTTTNISAFELSPSNKDNGRWEHTFTDLEEVGDYNVEVIARDPAGNTETLETMFRISENKKFEGSFVDSSNNDETGEFSLSDTNTNKEIHKFNLTGNYSEEVLSGSYNIEIQYKNHRIRMQNVNIDEDKENPIKIEELGGNAPSPPREQSIASLGAEESLNPEATQIQLSYDDEELDGLNSEELLIARCPEYNYDQILCESGFENFNVTENDISRSQNTITIDTDGFSSYTAFIPSEEFFTTDDQEPEESSSPATEEDVTELSEQIGDLRNPLQIRDESIDISLAPGETETVEIRLLNNIEEEITYETILSPEVERFVDVQETLTLEAEEEQDLEVTVTMDEEPEHTSYSGELELQGDNDTTSIPVQINVEEPETLGDSLDIEITPERSSLPPGDNLTIRTSVTPSSVIIDKEISVTYLLRPTGSSDPIIVKENATTFSGVYNGDERIEINDSVDTGDYVVEAIARYEYRAQDRQTSTIASITLERSLLNTRLFGIQVSTYLITLFTLVTIAGSSWKGYQYYLAKIQAKKRFKQKLNKNKLPGPKEDGGSGYMGKLAEDGDEAYLKLDSLTTHALVAGATGSGKSVTGQVIVEEALEKGKNVIVLDPTAQWSGYLRKCTSDDMLNLYSSFDMSIQDAHGYNGNIRAINSPDDDIDIQYLLQNDDDQGSIVTFSLHKLESDDIESFASSIIQQVFEANLEESEHLDTVIVFDEAHRLLEKFGGSGEGLNQLERGAREFRKWGVGMVLLSQVISDFPSEIRTNVGTKIQMRTRNQNDLDHYKDNFGMNTVQSIVKANVGAGMVQNSDYNNGEPYFVRFRPLKHSVHRLSDEELDKYEEYNQKIDKVEAKIDKMEESGQEVYEYRSNLKLCKKNLRKGSFNLVDIYLKELKQQL